VIKRKNREAGKRRDAEEKQHSRNQQMQGNHESIEAKKRNSRK